MDGVNDDDSDDDNSDDGDENDCEVLIYVDQIRNKSCLSVCLSPNCYFPPS